MNRTIEASFSQWFDQYTHSFHTGDEAVDVNFILKEEHTRRVERNCIQLAKSLQWTEEECLLAQTIGLFHDVGRFKQYADHRSFRDALTGSHATIGVSVLREEGVLSCLPEAEQAIILDSIEYHNRFAIPEGISESTLMFSRLIRDADKLDAFYSFTNDRETRKYNLDDLPDEPAYSPNVLMSFFQSKSVDYKEIKTNGDRRLWELALLYDLNFPYSLRTVEEEGYIKKLLNALPPSEEKEKIQEHVHAYLGLIQNPTEREE